MMNAYMGSVDLLLPEPSDLTPLIVTITAILPLHLPEGVIPRSPLTAKVTINVRKVTYME